MFDVVRNNPKIAQIFLVLISVPFALFGVDAYFRNGGVNAGAVAKIGKQEITITEFDGALRQQESAMRQQMGDSFNSSVLESPAFRASVLDRMVNERVLDGAISEGRFVIPDAYVQESIKAMPEFQENGHFSMRLYQALVSSPQGFEYKQRKDLEKRGLIYPLVESVKVPSILALHRAALDGEERSVSSLAFEAKARIGSIKLADGVAKKYYENNTKRFEQAEQVKLEYIVLSAEELAAQANVSEEDARKWYEEHKKERFTQQEERRASHILIQLAKDAKPEAKVAAKKKAEDLLAKVKAQPSRFAALAKEFSDDKMSAEKGGDLGFFGRDAMVKAFSDTTFQLKPKEISGIVESEYGYHIIQLSEIRGGGVKPFDEAKAEILTELRHQVASKRFGEIGEQFGNLVYEQPDALKPIAEKLGLKLQTTDWVSAASLPPGVLSNPKVRAAVFSAEAIKAKRNSEALDLGRATSVSVRVVEHKPARIKAFEEVKAEAENLAKLDEASKQTKAEGEGALAKLKSGAAVDGKWAAAKALKRSDQIPDNVRKAIFGVSAKQLPGYVGLADDGGYTIYRIEKVVAAKVDANDEKVKQMSAAYASSLGQEDLRAYILSLRNRLGVKIDDSKLKAKIAQ